MPDSLASASAFFLNDSSFSEYETLEQRIDNTDLFQIAVRKALELEKKAAYFTRQTEYRAFLLCDPPNLALGKLKHPAVSHTTKIHSSKAQEIFQQLNADPSPAFVLLTNNVLAKIGIAEFLQLRELTPHCLYIIQDYDCHHWYRMSAQCALLADIYVQGHFHTPPYVNLIASHPIKTIPIGSIQWEMDFLLANLPAILSQDRPVAISGKHSLYARFPYRNKLIATFGNAFPNVGFTDTHQFHQWTQEDKLRDWTSASLHFIAPVSCDLPIRVFDALVTGGKPVVPYAMASWLYALEIPENMFELYGPQDLVAPDHALSRWLSNIGVIAPSQHHEATLNAINRFHLNAVLHDLVSTTGHILKPMQHPQLHSLH